MASPMAFLPLLFFFLIALQLSQASQAVIGGTIRSIRTIQCSAPPTIEEETPKLPGRVLAVCQVNDNNPNLEIGFQLRPSILKTGDSFGELKRVMLFSRGSGLGEGIQVPEGIVLEDHSGEGRFVWAPGIQKTSTRNWVVEIRSMEDTPLLSPERSNWILATANSVDL